MLYIVSIIKRKLANAKLKQKHHATFWPVDV